MSLDLTELRRLCGAATRGPWWVEPEHWVGGHESVREAYIAYGDQGDLSETYDLLEKYEMADYAFIAAAREAVPQLLANMEILTAALDRIAHIGDTTGYSRTACARIARDALRAAARSAVPALIAALEAAEAQNILLSRAYAYADHLLSCPAVQSGDCGCGYREIAAAVEEG